MTDHATYTALELMRLRAVEATPATTQPLWGKGKEPPPVPRPAPMPVTAARMAAAARHYDVPRCLECHTRVIIHRDTLIWSCLGCGRGGWCMTVCGRDVRVVDSESVRRETT